jgi:predicted RNase H-like HicB family nuclease
MMPNTPTPRFYQALTERTSYKDGTLCYHAWYPDLPGCEVDAPGEAEALVLLDELRSFYIERLNARGLEVPPPTFLAEAPRKVRSRGGVTGKTYLQNRVYQTAG